MFDVLGYRPDEVVTWIMKRCRNKDRHFIGSIITIFCCQTTFILNKMDPIGISALHRAMKAYHGSHCRRNLNYLTTLL